MNAVALNHCVAPDNHVAVVEHIVVGERKSKLDVQDQVAAVAHIVMAKDVTVATNGVMVGVVGG